MLELFDAGRTPCMQLVSQLHIETLSGVVTDFNTAQRLATASGQNGTVLLVGACRVSLKVSSSHRVALVIATGPPS